MCKTDSRKFTSEEEKEDAAVFLKMSKIISAVDFYSHHQTIGLKQLFKGCMVTLWAGNISNSI